MKYVIVGAGPAGVIAAETLRKTDTEGEIILFSDEPEPPYSRMAIPYLLIENIKEEGTFLRKDQGCYEQKNIQVMHDRVTGVDAANKSVTLQSGASQDYDRLLIASGSQPIKPPVPGMDLPGVHNCWTLADAREILALAKPGAKVVLIGAGFIGCIILEALAERKVELSVLEMGDRMVPRMMNQTAGGLIKQWCESKGIKVYTSTQVTGVEKNTAQAPAAESGGGGLLQSIMNAIGLGSKEEAAPPPSTSTHPLRVSLDNGEHLEADLVISAAGVKPNIEFLQGTGVEIDRGIVVNHHLQSSVPEIYAAGDVCQGRDFSTLDFEVHAIQPTASEHGRVAALNMAGVPTYYRGSLNMNVLDTLGLVSSSFGQWMGAEGGDSVETVDAEHFRYINLEFKGDVMVGATSLGLTQHVGVLRGLIQGQVPLGEWKERLKEDPNRVMEAYLAKNYTVQH